GPAVPPPPPEIRGPAVPPPPMLGDTPPDPVHAPIDTAEVALPSEGTWTIREPGAEEEPDAVLGDASWAGVRPFAAEPAAFEPSVAPVDADSWEDDEATVAGDPTPEQRAEVLAARGELAEALRIYQEEALARPDEPHLWDR